jgi:hypothetical protein
VRQSTPGQSTQLRGRAHIRALEALIQSHDEVVARRQPSVVVVEGAPGVGKSKLLLELYRALGLRQAEPRYWPEPDASWNGYPSSVCPRGAEMSYFWWGIPCPPAGRARPFQVLGDEITQIEAHAALLMAADRVGEAASHAAQDYLVDVATGLATDLVPGSSTAIALGRGLLRVLVARGRVQTMREELLEGKPVDAVDVERDDLVTRAVSALAELGEAVPIVLAIDDAQSADPSLGRLLAEAMVLPVPLQIVVATQPVPVSAHPLGQLLEAVPNEYRLTIGNLEQYDAVDMVAARIPRAPREIVLALARKSAGSPRSVETLLGLLRPRDATVEAGLTDVEGLPDDYADQLRRLWSETLPESTKELLSVAGALSGPEGEVAVDLLILALDHMRPDSRGEDTLEDAVANFRWLLRFGSVARFAQPQHQLVARERSVFMRSDTDELIGVVMRSLTELTQSGLIEELSVQDARSLRETHLRFALEGGSCDRMADADAAFALSVFNEKIGNDRVALELREQSISWAQCAGVEGQALANLRSSLIGLLMQNGRMNDAERLLGELIDGPLAGNAVRETAAMSLLLMDMRSSGTWEEGVAALTDMVAGFDEREPTGRAALAGHVNLAFVLNRLNRHEDALRHHLIVKQRLQADPAARVDMSLLRTDLNIAATLRRVQGLEASMSAFDALEVEPLDSAGAQQVCLARLRVLHAAAADGDAGVIGHLGAVLAQSVALLGVRHRDVRGSVNVLGDQLLSAGAYQEAVDLYSRYPAPIDLADADQIDLSSAFNHGTGLMRIGRQADAVPILEGVTRRASALLGEDHEVTVMALAHLVHAALDAHDRETATLALCNWMLRLGAEDEWRKAACDTLTGLNGMLSSHGRRGVVPALLLPARATLIRRGDAIASLYLSQWLAGLFGQADEFEQARGLAAEATEMAAALGHEQARLSCQLAVADACRMLHETNEAVAIYRDIAEHGPDDDPVVMVARQRLRELEVDQPG